MLKGLWLSILGWFRSKAANATDLRYAGKEHISQIKSSVEDLIAQRDRIAGNGIVAEEDLAKAQAKAQEYADAVRHHKTAGDNAKAEQAYGHYQKWQTEAGSLEARVEKFKTDVANLDAEIDTLERGVDKAKDTLDEAASNQLVGKANQKVEGIHRDLASGPLGDAIDASRENTATAQAARVRRESKDGESVLEYKQQGNVLSMDELLGATPTSGSVQND